MGVIVGCNHMGWGILGERLQLVTSILTGFRPHVVTDSAGVFAGFGYFPWYAAYSPPVSAERGLRGTVVYFDHSGGNSRALIEVEPTGSICGKRI